MENVTNAKEVSLADRIARLRDGARRSRTSAGFLAGIGAAGVGLELMNNLVASNNKVAAAGSCILMVAGVGLGVPEALESMQLGNEIVALEVVQAAQRTDQPEAQAPEAG